MLTQKIGLASLPKTALTITVLLLLPTPGCSVDGGRDDPMAWTSGSAGTTGTSVTTGDPSTTAGTTATSGSSDSGNPPPDAGDATTSDPTGDPTGATTDPTGDPTTTTTGGEPGCYWEEINPDADLSDLENGYNSSKWKETYFQVLQRRWPAGYDLLVAEQNDPYFGAFADTSSFSGLMDSVMTEVHENTHGWDYGHASVNDFAFYLRADLTFHPPKIHGFARSEILSMVVGDSTSLYDGTYLTGEQGTRGFYELLDEMNCYINGMAGSAVVAEYVPWGFSGIDGAVAFLYYLELYLKRARTQYPDVYAQLQQTPEYVELVEVQWLRTHFFLEYADAHSNTGIKDQEIRALMYQADNMAEIEMFIGKPVEASPCLP